MRTQNGSPRRRHRRANRRSRASPHLREAIVAARRPHRRHARRIAWSLSRAHRTAPAHPPGRFTLFETPARKPPGARNLPQPHGGSRDGVRDGVAWCRPRREPRGAVSRGCGRDACALPPTPPAPSSAPSSSFHLLGLTTPELKSFATDRGWPAFRGKQLRDHLYGAKPARDIDDLTTLSKSMRAELAAANVAVGRSSVHTLAAAADGTAKLLLRLGDDRVVETVGIPATEGGKNRLTACISSQVGCPMRCTFCATGKGGFARNLAPHEIVDQVMSLEEHFGRRVSVCSWGWGRTCPTS